MKERKQRKADGYLTVEAALLLPFVIGVLVYIIYFQLFWYNRCLMDQEATMTAVKAAQADSTDRDALQGEVSRWREEFLTDRYVGWEADRPALTSQADKLSVRIRGRLTLPNDSWNAESVCEADRINVSAFLRQCRKTIMWMEEEK